ncbi:hypothetical protein RND81_10G103100 [Saponaria officinalis]|uniref:Uncharacterized protein n=1 Tax=Saponaria officinalis TaxID=3572 RepID=A0AAW1I2Y9_SAPOF
MNPLISILITHGRSLASHLAEAKHKSKLGRMHENSDVHKNVEIEITKMLNEFDTTIFIDDVDARTMNKVLQKVEETLQKFTQLDDKKASTYVKLQNQVETLRRNKFVVGNYSAQHLLSKSSPQQASSFCSLLDDSDFEEAYENISPKELDCLLCVIKMLSSMTKEVKKKDLVNWLIGMEMIEDPLEGEQVLGKLVDEGFIDRVIENKTIHNRFKMHQTVLDKLERKMNTVRFRHKLLESNLAISIIDDRREETNVEKIIGLLNINRVTLNSKTFESISKMKNVKLLSLGSSGSPYIGDRLIEVERVINLRSTLRNLSKVKCLSLEGISRIVILPNTIFKLKNLKVLDLKACHDLTIIPRGIRSLSSLTYLDLTMCYMLDHTPFEVSELRNLVVLKGFVINDNDTYIRYDVPCVLHHLTEFRYLTKLSIRTRRVDFPNQEDFEALRIMDELINLKITWIGKSDESSKKIKYLDNVFPKKLKKIGFEAAPATIASQLLELISKQIGMEKVYIKGGRLWDFGPSRAIKFDHVKFLRLRYLHNLHINWSDFQSTFLNLERLEIFECRNLIFFPCDQNGVWECLE